MSVPRDIASLCTYCGHGRHDDACARTITTRTGKKPTEAPCPCTRHLKETP